MQNLKVTGFPTCEIQLCVIMQNYQLEAIQNATITHCILIYKNHTVMIMNITSYIHMNATENILESNAYQSNPKGRPIL